MMSKMKDFRVLLASGESEARAEAVLIVAAAAKKPALAAACKAVAKTTM
jgi:hypothetical protein